LKRRGSFYISVFFTLLGLAGIIQSLTFRYWEAMILPLILSILIFIAAAIEMIKEIAAGDRAVGQTDSTPGKLNGSKSLTCSAILLPVWAGAFVLTIWLFGFLIAIPLFAFSYLKWRKRSWLISGLFAFLATVIPYLLFDIAINAPLYRGLVFGGH
jgi:hypothetical protein